MITSSAASTPPSKRLDHERLNQPLPGLRPDSRGFRQQSRLISSNSRRLRLELLAKSSSDCTIWATWQQMKCSPSRVAGVRSSLKSSCCTGNMKANVERVVPITIQYHKSMAIQQDNSPWGRMAHSTSPTVNRSSIPAWPVSRGAMAREMDADLGTKKCGEKSQADDPHPMHTEIPRGANGSLQM